jgi:hypothetical protein
MVQIGFAPRKLHMATSPAIFLVQLQSDRVSDILMLLFARNLLPHQQRSHVVVCFFISSLLFSSLEPALPHLIRQLMII